MTHTYLLQPGKWKAKGENVDADGKVSPVEGESEIRHGDDVWELNGVMRVMGDEPAEFRMDYQIKPIAPGDKMTTWEAENSSLGPLEGTMVIEGETLQSSFTSKDGQFKGNESLVRIDDDTYHLRGSLMKGDAIMSTWTVELRREI